MKGRNQMFARLDNFGPFHIFYTVLTAVLRERGIGVRCNINNDDQTEEYEVLTHDYGRIPMEIYKDDVMDETMHKVLRNIILHPSNPLSVKHYCKRLDFQGCGSGHDHGVLWLDLKKLEQKVDKLQLQHLKNNLEAILPNHTIYQKNLRSSSDSEVKSDLDLFCIRCRVRYTATATGTVTWEN